MRTTSTASPAMRTRRSAPDRRVTCSSSPHTTAPLRPSFERLRRAGITRENTLFVFTVDEGDHFVGGSPTPASCDGIQTPCDWTGQVGELNAKIDTLIGEQFPSLKTQFLERPRPTPS